MLKGVSICIGGQQSERGVAGVSLDSKAIIILCSHLCVGENVKPYEPAEWSRLAERLVNEGIRPCEVLSFCNDDFRGRLGFAQNEIDRMNRLIERSGSIAFEIERYASMGIYIMTRADAFYPRALKQKLAKSCPPIFYYAGNATLAERKCVGFVGSRSINGTDEDFTIKTVQKCNEKGFGVVSGGAKGIDSIARTASIENGGFCVEYIADSLVRKIKDKSVVTAVLDNRLLVLSVAKPDAGFSTGFAMMRNKYIYSQSEGTVVVKSDYNKGGTWSGAINNLKSKRSATFCWNNPEYRGNTELISKGAVPIDWDWDADLLAYDEIDKANDTSEQLSLFEI